MLPRPDYRLFDRRGRKVQTDGVTPPPMLDSLRYKAHILKRKLLIPFRKRFNVVNAWDDPRRDKVLCKSCQRLVSFSAYHSGFSAITPIYCTACPDVLLLDDYEARFPYGNATCKPTSNFGLNWKLE